MMGLPEGRKKIDLAVLIHYRRVTDTQPPSQPASHVAVASTRYAYLLRAVKTVYFHSRAVSVTVTGNIRNDSHS